MTIEEIYREAADFINKILRKELVDQGHHLTGALEESIAFTISKTGDINRLEGFAAHYSQFVEHGFPASSASYKQVPFLIDYFIARGLDEKEATAAAFATVTVWMKEGMPTQASKRFSSTGSRTNFVDHAFTEHAAEINKAIEVNIDKAVDELFKREKNEII